VPLADLAEGLERDQMFDRLHELLRAYRATLEHDRRELLEEFRLTDFARKVVGVGSVGTRAWIALMLGRDGQDALFLQMEEAEASVLEEFVAPSEFENHGERVVTGQRLMQASSDIFLGWLHVEEGLDGKERDFYGRQLRDWKGSAEIEQMIPKGTCRSTTYTRTPRISARCASATDPRRGSASICVLRKARCASASSRAQVSRPAGKVGGP
jgi:Uncharacterized protein conserved in bacteria (DUF2252)